MGKNYITNSNLDIDFEEILVETNEYANKYKFRGSPTILINDNNIYALEANETPSLSCGFYNSGLPYEKTLNDFIILFGESTK